MSFERLTGKHADGSGYYMFCSGRCRYDDPDACAGCGELERIVDKLGAYEDSGLEPEETMEAIKINGGKAYELPTVFGESFEHIRELIEAEKEGRLVVLPCKVGQDVYEVVRYRDESSRHILRLQACGIHIGKFPDLRGHKRKSYLVVTYPTSSLLGQVNLDNVGKTVFLTREEAEAALGKGPGCDGFRG